MGKGTPSAPPAPQPPDPAFVASAQQGANINTAIGNAWMNNMNQRGPYGSLTYNQTGMKEVGNGYSVPTWEAVTTLSPEQQRLYEAQLGTQQGATDLANKAIGRIGQATSTPFNYEGLPAAPQYDENFRQNRLDTILQRANPQQTRDRAAFEQRLADQGIGIGDEAYKTSWDQFQRGQNDFRLGADLQSMTEAERAYALSANTRDRAIQERANLRSQPINEVAALLGLGGGVQNPSFVNTPQTSMQAPDMAGIYGNNYAGQMAGYNSMIQQQQMAQQQQAAAMGGLAGLAGTLGGFALGGPMGGMIGGSVGRGAGGLFGLGGR